MKDELNRILKLYKDVPSGPAWHIDNWTLNAPYAFYYEVSKLKALVQMLNTSNIGRSSLKNFKVLDIGCENGKHLRWFMELGVQPKNCFGIELVPHHVYRAKTLHPLMHYSLCLAQELPFKNETFDMVTQFVVFCVMGSHELRKKAASEMLRVLKPGGIIVWQDFCENNPRGFSQKQLYDFFPGCDFMGGRMLLKSWCVSAFLRLKKGFSPLMNLLEYFPFLKDGCLYFIRGKKCE